MSDNPRFKKVLVDLEASITLDGEAVWFRYEDHMYGEDVSFHLPADTPVMNIDDDEPAGTIGEVIKKLLRKD